MGLVKFGDYVKEVKINIDRNNNPYEYYVAGDHMDSEDLTIRRKGLFATDDVGPAFTRLFKPGQILYGSRRTYLKKVAVADFEGICSNTTFVLETKDENKLRQRLLPFIMLTDDFTKWSISKSKGSTNPYILFSDLANYEFELPDINKQDELVKLLWQAYATKESYREMIRATDEMVKSQFIEMIGDSRSNPKGWDIYTLRELVVPSCPISYGIVQPGEDIEEGGVPIVRPVDLDDTHRVTSKGLKRTTKEISDAYRRTILEGNELLLCVRGTTGLVGLATEELKGCNVTRGITPLSFNERVDRVFMLCMFLSDGIQEFISDNTIGSALRGINMAVIREMKFPVPPIDIQRSFVSLYVQADKSKFELKQAIEKIDKVMRALMQ